MKVSIVCSLRQLPPDCRRTISSCGQVRSAVLSPKGWRSWRCYCPASVNNSGPNLPTATFITAEKPICVFVLHIACVMPLDNKFSRNRQSQWSRTKHQPHSQCTKIFGCPGGILAKSLRHESFQQHLYSCLTPTMDDSLIVILCRSVQHHCMVNGVEVNLDVKAMTQPYYEHFFKAKSTV